MTFGQFIAEARKRANYSQKELAELIMREDGKAISPQYLNDIERDRRNPPSEYIIEQMAQVLKVPSDYLFHLAGEVPTDLRDTEADAETIEAAYSVFRKTLRGE